MKDWISEIDEITLAAQGAFGALSPEALNRKPAPDRWSVAQCLDHLIVINRTYFPVVEDLLNERYHAPLHARIPFFVRFFGKLLLDSVQPDRRRKMRTFPIWEPSSSAISGDIVERFAQHQEELKDLIHHSEGLLAAGAVIASPANRVIVYKLETAFDIIVAHERRHLAQAMEVEN